MLEYIHIVEAFSHHTRVGTKPIHVVHGWYGLCHIATTAWLHSVVELHRIKLLLHHVLIHEVSATLLKSTREVCFGIEEVTVIRTHLILHLEQTLHLYVHVAAISRAGGPTQDAAHLHSVRVAVLAVLLLHLLVELPHRLVRIEVLLIHVSRLYGRHVHSIGKCITDCWLTGTDLSLTVPIHARRRTRTRVRLPTHLAKLVHHVVSLPILIAVELLPGATVSTTQ